MWLSISQTQFLSLRHDYFKSKSKLKHTGEGKGKKGNWEVPLFSFITRNVKGLQLFGHNKIQTALY